MTSPELQAEQPSAPQETNAENLNQSNVEAANDNSPIEDLEGAYDKQDRTDTMLEMAQKNFENDKKKLEELRNDMDLQEPANDNMAGQKDLEAIQKREEAMEQEVENLEKIALGVPEDFSGETQPNQSAEINPPEENLQDKAAEMAEGFEASLQVERKKAVEKFIKDSTEQVQSHFSSYIDDCENKNEANNLIALKIQHEVGKAGERFIKEGGKPDYGFQMDLSVTEHDTPEGKTRAFVTGITLEIKGKQIELGSKESLEGKKLLDEKGDKELKQAEEAGTLEENTLKSA